jgi:signal transduction histidine kinase/CheY-like chemotaxis protein
MAVEIPLGPDEAVRSLYRSPEGAGPIWAGTTDQRILRYDGDAWQEVDVAAGGVVTSFCETTRRDGARVLWAGTDGGGLWRFADGQWRVFTTASGLPNNSFWSLLPVEARKGTSALWLGTDGGAGRMEFGRWTSFDARNGLPTDSVYGLAETVDADGLHSVWIGTRGGGIARLRDGVWKVYGASSGLPNSAVFSLFETTEADGRKTLWAGSQAGLARFENERWQAVSVPGASVGTVRAAREAVRGDRRVTWAAAGGGGVLRYENGVWSVLGTASGLPTDNVFCVQPTVGPKGEEEVWAGTAGAGIARYLDGRWESWNTDNSTLPNNSVLSLHEWRAPDGRRWLWAGTEGGGAARLDLERPEAGWTVLSDTTTPALPNNTVYQIREDGAHRLYLTTNKGVARLTPRAPTEDDPAELSVLTFTTEDGLPSNESNGGASAVDSLGRIWVGTPAGAAVFDPAAEIPDDRAGQLYVEGTVAGEAEHALAPGVSLSHDENALVFESTLVSYHRPRDTRYRTQLVGLDRAPSAWSADAKRSYTPLPAGDYTFRVWARDYAGNVSGPVDFPFVVRPAPWQTWWAYLLYLAALAGAAYLLVRYRLAALRRRNEELRAAIAERTVQLAEKVSELEVSERAALSAKEEAVDANRAKSLFLSNMSHELRTPLNAVLGFAQLMGRDATLSDESRDNLDVIQRSGEHLLELINDVLSLSKIEAGKVTLADEVFDLPRLLEVIEEMIRVRANAKELRLVVDLDPALPRIVRGDEGKLRQVLLNLLNNAVKFTDAGGVALRARWEEGRAFFEVEDTGQGIAPGEIETIFDAFVQSESGVRWKEGTGLGLAISRSFVELMDGRLSVRSEVGRGTVFAFDVALATADEAEVPVGPSRVVGLAPGEPRYRVLVVDDGWENRALLGKLLAGAGFDVREAGDGREAIAVWREWEPDFIWMDMRMPFVDGVAATREIRRRERDEKRRRCKIVALTASAFEHEREKVIAAGCDDYVTKPYREATIFDRLAEHLGARFVYEGEPQEARREEEPSSAALEGARLAAIPADLVARLHEALVLGNVRDARAVVDRVEAHDAALADDLRRLVRGYRFDEILDAIDALGLAN